MTATVSGRTLLSHRPNARTFVLWRVEAESSTHYHWRGETRRHATVSDAYDAIGLPPEQAPNAESIHGGKELES